MIFNEAQFNTWLAAYLWPMVRISAMLVAIPLFSSRQIPARFRLFMMILITLLIAPTLPPQPQADVLSHTGFIIS